MMWLGLGWEIGFFIILFPTIIWWFYPNNTYVKLKCFYKWKAIDMNIGKSKKEKHPIVGCSAQLSLSLCLYLYSFYFYFLNKFFYVLLLSYLFFLFL